MAQGPENGATFGWRGRIFGGAPINLEAKLEVWDSPNSAGVVVDAVRCAKLAMDRGEGGAVVGPSAYFMKSPPIQYTDDAARDLTDSFITGAGKQAEGPLSKRRSPPTRVRQGAPDSSLRGVPLKIAPGVALRLHLARWRDHSRVSVGQGNWGSRATKCRCWPPIRPPANARTATCWCHWGRSVPLPSGGSIARVSLFLVAGTEGQGAPGA